MTCGHVTDYETQQVYRAWATRGKYFCEACGHWRKAVPRPRYPELPDEPPF